ncbi:MAG: hypothetical protein H7X97_06985, partial [Opitutaceae bacterium]|nr:hypothetical protein [Verrucomicrobiales bacterium]
MKSRIALTCFHCLLALSPAAFASDTDRPARNVDGIADNSFLVEEAYNQEAGVVQHIFTALYEVSDQSQPDERTWALAFTQEWPLFTQAHQLSYTLPYEFVEADGQSSDGLGDVLLHYRYQAYFNPETLMAFSP